jgi:vacuolar-type H+-ATPase subunit E/Vma4
VRAELIKNKNLADVEIERRKRIIEFKAGITGGLEAAAVKRLKKNYYEKFFGMLLEKGIVEIGSENLEVVVSKEDAELAKKLLKKMRIKAKIKTMHIMGGCLVRSGRVAANYSIESILKRKKGQIEKKINEMFFSD